MAISVAQNSVASAPADLAQAPCRVVRNDAIFRRGERKTHLYFIEGGTVGLYEARNGTHTVVEFAFAGDTIGFGFLDRHIYSAQAVGEARIRALPLTALDHVLEGDKRALQRYAEALQREFEFRRSELLSAERKPASRVAALFVALSRRNQEEGQDPSVIADSLDCGTVASYLKLDVATLGQALAELERAQLIERSSSQELRLTDLPGLEQRANEIIQ